MGMQTRPRQSMGMLSRLRHAAKAKVAPHGYAIAKAKATPYGHHRHVAKAKAASHGHATAKAKDARHGKGARSQG